MHVRTQWFVWANSEKFFLGKTPIFLEILEYLKFFSIRRSSSLQKYQHEAAHSDQILGSEHHECYGFYFLFCVEKKYACKECLCVFLHSIESTKQSKFFPYAKAKTRHVPLLQVSDTSTRLFENYQAKHQFALTFKQMGFKKHSSINN